MRVALIGPMGVGKSTVGRLLSHILEAPFLDLDEEIVRDSGLSIPEIFAAEGECGFRERELQVLRSVTDGSQDGLVVCAMGGGVVVTPKCREMLRTAWKCVFLDANLQTLVEHLAEEADKRPLLQESNLADKVQSIYEARVHYYRDLGDICITVNGKGPQEIANDVAAQLSTARDERINRINL